MRRYVFDRIRTGSFLNAVLSNDLRTAVRRADPFNKHRLVGIIEFCENVLPPNAWGSEKHVDGWVMKEPLT